MGANGLPERQLLKVNAKIRTKSGVRPNYLRRGLLYHRGRHKGRYTTKRIGRDQVLWYIQ